MEETDEDIPQMGEIYFIRQKTREYFEPNTPGQLLVRRLHAITLGLTLRGDHRPATYRR